MKDKDELTSRFKKLSEKLSENGIEFDSSEFNQQSNSEIRSFRSEVDESLRKKKENFKKEVLDSIKAVKESMNLSEQDVKRKMNEEYKKMKRESQRKFEGADLAGEKYLRQLNREVEQFNFKTHAENESYERRITKEAKDFINSALDFDTFDDYDGGEWDYPFDEPDFGEEVIKYETITGESRHISTAPISPSLNDVYNLEYGDEIHLTNDPEVCNDKTNWKNDQNTKTEGEPVATAEKSRSELDTTANDETEGDMHLDKASKKLDELQSAVDKLIGQKVTSSNAQEYVNEYNVIEKGISQFLNSLVPLVEDNQRRKAKRDEIEKLRSIWESNKEKCEVKIEKYSNEYEAIKLEMKKSKSVDIVDESKADNLKYVLDEWNTLHQLATTHTGRIARDVDNLNIDMQKINKISYQISSFNLRLRTLIVTNETYVSSLGIGSQELNNIQKALNVSLEKIKTLEQEQLAITKGV